MNVKTGDSTVKTGFLEHIAFDEDLVDLKVWLLIESDFII